jgi:molybdenum cofactor guanylyltransferase
MASRFAGIVLAGGESRRFGSPKAFAKRDEIPFYQYSIDVLAPLCQLVIVVTRPDLYQMFDEGDKKFKVMIDKEPYKGQGPLSGIYSAMDEVSAQWYMVLPTDVPFIEQWVCRQLMEQIDSEVDAVVPIVLGKEQPLIAIYHQSVKETIEKQLSRGRRSLKSLFEQIKVKYVQIDKEQPFRNINRPEDFL